MCQDSLFFLGKQLHPFSFVSIVAAFSVSGRMEPLRLKPYSVKCWTVYLVAFYWKSQPVPARHHQTLVCGSARWLPAFLPCHSHAGIHRVPANPRPTSFPSLLRAHTPSPSSHRKCLQETINCKFLHNTSDLGNSTFIPLSHSFIHQTLMECLVCAMQLVQASGQVRNDSGHFRVHILVGGNKRQRGNIHIHMDAFYL